MRWICSLWLLLCCSAATYAASRQLSGERVYFLSGTSTLQGCVFKPKGKGPFPAVVFNQGASKSLSGSGPVNPFPALAEFYTSRGYLFFVPGRHFNIKRGNEDEAETSGGGRADANEKWQEGQDFHLQNVIASINWLKAQSYVDEKRIVMTGFSSGGVTTILAAEQKLGLRGYVAFSAAAATWRTNPYAQQTMRRAVKNAEAPIFLIQPDNDVSLKPTEVLGQELESKGEPNRTRIYKVAPSTNRAEINRFATDSIDVWGEDVLAFIKDVLK